MVATSQPLAAQAGLAMLARGGNAVDAALATTFALTVVEPTGCGLGSDAFAIVWDGARLHGLNASGHSPAAWTPDLFAGREKMPERGWNAVTVPGAVGGWIALWRKFGSLPLATLAEPAIGYARDGFAVSPSIAFRWEHEVGLLSGQPGFAETFTIDGRAPRTGETMRLPALAASLALIAESEGEAFYRGELAARMVAHARSEGGAMSADDLAAERPDWVATISVGFAGSRVHELPPNGQGMTALIGLGIAERAGIGSHPVDDVETLHVAIEATKLAIVDTAEYLADPGHLRVGLEDLLSPSYLDERAKLVDPARAGDPGHGAPKPSGTVYLATGDAGGMMVSLIQSNYMGFGSGVVVPGTGISLQNRGAGFTLRPGHANTVGPRKRPAHTIIPGFAMNGDGTPLMSFGVMGGPMQPQGHLQLAIRTMLYGEDPQSAIDSPRWRVVSGRKVAVEADFDPRLIAALAAKGHDVVVDPPDSVFAFGGAQIVRRDGAGYVGGSDARKDGQAVGF
ncbi:MAG: gamma-glutamyltransferase family protein [Rhizobiales bacterium]|nr:gamma-glutamyltransferase family protein [Hyphomicrobiales bacterium]